MTAEKGLGPGRSPGPCRPFSPMRPGSSIATSSRRTCSSPTTGSSSSVTSAWPSSSAAIPAARSPTRVLGTPSYMAPEQGRRGVVQDRTGRRHLRPWGAILYHALVGNAHPSAAPRSWRRSIRSATASLLFPVAIGPIIAPRPGDHLSQVPPQRAGEAVSDGPGCCRGVEAIPRRRADPGKASGGRLIVPVSGSSVIPGRPPRPRSPTFAVLGFVGLIVSHNAQLRAENQTDQREGRTRPGAMENWPEATIGRHKRPSRKMIDRLNDSRFEGVPRLLDPPKGDASGTRWHSTRRS